MEGPSVKESGNASFVKLSPFVESNWSTTIISKLNSDKGIMNKNLQNIYKQKMCALVFVSTTLLLTFKNILQKNIESRFTK